MQLKVHDDMVVAVGIDWAARWVKARPFRGQPVQVLSLARTALSTITDADVDHFMAFGHWPAFDRLAVRPSWGVPERYLDKTMTANRKEFHLWRSESTMFGGRPLALTYDQALAARQARSHPKAQALGFDLSYPSFALLATGAAYWWVQAGDPNWMGWTWTGETK